MNKRGAKTVFLDCTEQIIGNATLKRLICAMYCGTSKQKRKTTDICEGWMTMTNEKRLIDVNDVYSLFNQSGIARLHVSDIDTIPRVDAVEVVRCRDCIHYFSGACLKIYSDGDVSQYAWQERNEDDFCSYGERKEGAD